MSFSLAWWISLTNISRYNLHTKKNHCRHLIRNLNLSMTNFFHQKMGREQIFKNTFQGIFSDQKICKDCPHRWATGFYCVEFTKSFSLCMKFDSQTSFAQIWAWGNIHGTEPWSDLLSEFRDLIRPVCPRRGARGQQCLLLWEMQREGLYTPLHAFIQHWHHMCL